MRSGQAVLDNAKLNGVDCNIHVIDSIRPDYISQVRTLYLSNNCIAALDGVEAYYNVESLSLANNQITYLHHLNPLRYLNNLRKLAIVGNPVVEMPYFRHRLLLLCPNLRVLDGKPVKICDHQEAHSIASTATITSEQLMLNELRNTILSHVSRVTAVQVELLYEVCGRYAAIRGGDLPTAADGTKACMDRTGTIIRRLLQGGCFYMLQIGCREHFDVMIQDISRSASQVLKRSNSSRGGNDSSNSHKKHWDTVFTQIMGNQHQEWMLLIHQSEQNRDQVLEFYTKGRVRAGAGAVLMEANQSTQNSLNSSKSRAIEFNTIVHKTYNQVAAADAQQSLELIQFLKPSAGDATSPVPSLDPAPAHTSALPIDVTLETSQMTGTSAFAGSIANASKSLDPVLQRLYAGVSSNSFMRRKNPANSLDTNTLECTGNEYKRQLAPHSNDTAHTSTSWTTGASMCKVKKKRIRESSEYWKRSSWWS